MFHMFFQITQMFLEWTENIINTKLQFIFMTDSKVFKKNIKMSLNDFKIPIAKKCQVFKHKPVYGMLQ